MTDAPLNPYRLPQGLRPRRYDITIAPDLHRRDFVGQVDIELDVAEPTAMLTCNAAELEIVRAWVIDGSGTRIDPSAITLDAEMERMTVSLQRTLVPGPATLHVEFVGSLNDRLAGFYTSTYTAPDGSTKVIATTQFESTDARKAFPCWDEPDAKAVFGVTLVVEQGLMAISNAPQAGETTLASGKRAIRFADTMVMSTYLVCFVVGELVATDPVVVNGVPVRIVHRPGVEHLTRFGMEIGTFALDWFARYYDIAYPGLKLDLIALPDFASGAMENLGAVTFRETVLLADESTASRAELERVADVVAHEIAHMWFGDLVTMSWWNGLWLNEAFATFMEIACVAAFKPEWDRWTSFGIYRSMAMGVDALHSTRAIEYPVVSPHDAENMFDVLTYEKGASVLRMLEQYLGEDRFRSGVRHYLRTHSYANTETTDLWDAIEEITGEPVRQMMDGWIFQGGFPLVSIARTGGAVELSQRRFTYLPGAEERSWDVPVLVREGVEPTGRVHRVALGGSAVRVGLPDGSAPIVNAGGHGFYRVRYDDDLLAELRSRASELSAIERYGLVSDTWSAVVAGASGITAFCDLLGASGAGTGAGLASVERDPNVWSAMLAGLGTIDQIVPDDARPGFSAWVLDLLGPVVEELGWEPAEGESALRGQLRGQVLASVGILGADAATIVTGAELADRIAADGLGSIDPEVGAAAIGLGAVAGGDQRWEAYRQARRRSSVSPQEALRYLHALGSFRDAAQVDATLRLTLSDEVRSQDTPYALQRMLMSRTAGPVAWAFIEANWEAIVAHIPHNSVARMLEGIAHRSEPDTVAAITHFLRADGGVSIPQGVKLVTQSLERMRVLVLQREREADALRARFG